MDNEKFDKKKIIAYWVENANDDYETMRVMLQSKRYSWALFLGHLVIEKLLKACFVKTKNEYPPYIHNLLRLALGAELEISEEMKVELTTISAFNINARYDDYKNSFQKQCTPEYTQEWVEKIEKIRKWTHKQINS